MPQKLRLKQNSNHSETPGGWTNIGYGKTRLAGMEKMLAKTRTCSARAGRRASVLLGSIKTGIAFTDFCGERRGVDMR
ncbi:hypothetical protein [Paraburkholderia diazotrophica]|uniref:hypothetical protein n=1 Tax=Paraburkholderia diazotrophica TaxID=667676 RepID=UPI00115F870E|nr:hypothetical protein [Paraburkholderia diazotrophica]